MTNHHRGRSIPNNCKDKHHHLSSRDPIQDKFNFTYETKAMSASLAATILETLLPVETQIMIATQSIYPLLSCSLHINKLDQMVEPLKFTKKLYKICIYHLNGDEAQLSKLKHMTLFKNFPCIHDFSFFSVSTEFAFVSE